jgi:hypothetical protein
MELDGAAAPPPRVWVRRRRGSAWRRSSGPAATGDRASGGRPGLASLGWSISRSIRKKQESKK